MNGKRAKQIRKIAINLTGGGLPRSHVEGPKGQRMVQAGANPDGTPHIVTRDITGTIRLNPECTRAVYRKLKRWFKRGYAHVPA